MNNFPIFDLTSNYGHSGISESGIINFFLNPSIALTPLLFSPLHRLITFHNNIFDVDIFITFCI